jgi:hypothetical protein
MVDESKPASEQFDLTNNMSFDADLDDVRELTTALEQADAVDRDKDDKALAEWVAALKALETAVEDARKDVFEAELDERTAVDDEVGPLVKRQGRNTWVPDDEAAFAAVADAGEDPMNVASVSIGDLRDVLGADADEYIDASTYEYFRRQG